MQGERAHQPPSTGQRTSVSLVHGIRTHAGWYREVRDTLEDAGFRVHLTNYGLFDLFRFILPIAHFRNRAKEHVFDQLRAAKQSDPDARFAVIAHSFGTYIVARILQDEFEISLSRIVFVGSVVPYNFPFEQFRDRFEDDILNEVGIKDPWPVIAESVTTGYGSTGTYGFKVPPVYDRWHDSSHSSILTACHCTRYRTPFLKEGSKVRPDDIPGQVPVWIRIISSIKIKHVLALALALLVGAWVLVLAYREPTVTIEKYPGSAGWTLGGDDLAAELNEEINKPCPLRFFFGRTCDNMIAKFITGRKWRTVSIFDHRIKDVVFCEEYTFTYRDPAEVWFDLAAKFPNHLVVTGNNATISVCVPAEFSPDSEEPGCTS